MLTIKDNKMLTVSSSLLVSMGSPANPGGNLVNNNKT
jgi:hypothetical protein